MDNQQLTITIGQSGWDTCRVVEHALLVVVIVTFNSARHIAKCLQPLAGNNIIVVDNASNDLTCEIVKRDFPNVRLIEASRNLGLSRAFNMAWREVPGCDVLFINPDVVANSPGIADLHDAMRLFPDAALLAPRLLNPDGSTQDSVRDFPSLASGLARRTPLGNTKWGAKTLRSYLQTITNTSEQPVDWALGAAMLIRGSALQLLRGFDERYFLYWEDADFCARAWRHNMATIYFPQVAFCHEYQRESRDTWNLLSAATRAHLRSTVRIAASYPAQYLGFRPLRPAGSSSNNLRER